MGRYAISSEEFTNDLVSVAFRIFFYFCIVRSYSIILTFTHVFIIDFTGLSNTTPLSLSRLVPNQEILDI